MRQSTGGKVAILSSVTLLLASALPATAFAQSGAGEVLTNDAVVQMVTGKLSKDLIMAKVQNTSNSFDLSASAIISLYESKVPREIIAAMMQTKPVKAPATEEVLTNDTVVRLVEAKVSKDIIIQKIKTTKTSFDVTAAGLVGLNQSKVPQDIIKIMMAPPPPPAKE
jgi:hypothetical protein